MGEGEDTGRPGSAEGRDTGGDVEGKGSLGGEETVRGKLDSTETGRPGGADKEGLGENVREGEDTGRPGGADKEGLGENVREGEDTARPGSADIQEGMGEGAKDTGRPGRGSVNEGQKDAGGPEGGRRGEVERKGTTVGEGTSRDTSVGSVWVKENIGEKNKENGATGSGTDGRG
ncbi:hypothetical protein XENTR_v10003435 [Xenopus tropicalis]|nr:hypothetical protein XENTR_v10003435 [Xenopus tropicalis]